MAVVAPDGEALATAFGLAPPKGPVVLADRGEGGRVWRLETSDGCRWAFKEPLRPVDPHRADEVLSLEQRVSAVGVRVPMPLEGVGGRALTSVVREDRSLTWVRGYEWVDTDEVAKVPAADVALDQLGSALAAIHRLPSPLHAGPDPGWWREPLTEGRVGELVASAGRAGVPWASDLADQASALEELRRLVIAFQVPQPTVLCHLDANRDNVRMGPGGSLVFFDWDEAGVGDPSCELAAALVEWCSPGPSARRLAAAYAGSGGPGRVDDVGAFSMVAAVFCHFVEMMVERALDPMAAEEERTRAVEAIDFKLGLQLTVSSLEDLVP